MTKLGGEANLPNAAENTRSECKSLGTHLDDIGQAVQHFTTQSDEKRDALVALHDIVHSEQDVYWTRFAAFAALEAGLLVLTSGDSTAKIVGIVSGFLLSAVWLWVQYKSRTYVDRGKSYYHRLRRELGLWWPEELNAVGKPWKEAMQMPGAEVPVARATSSTDLALLIPAALLVTWLVLALPACARQWIMKLVWE